MESALTSKGQATIPKAIREHLGLKPGGRIRFFIHPDGSVVILPQLPVSRLRGMLKSRKRRPGTIKEMDEAIATDSKDEVFTAMIALKEGHGTFADAQIGALV
jgi:antitoxin PrlF